LNISHLFSQVTAVVPASGRAAFKAIDPAGWPFGRQPGIALALLAMACLVLTALISPPAWGQARVGSMVGTQPALVVDTLDGDRFDLAEQRGRWVVINFWATWCAPCIKEIPELSELADRDDVVVLGLDYEEIERDELDAFLAQHQPRYAIAPIDPWQPLAGFPVPRGLPVTYLIDAGGTVVEAWLGPVDKTMIEQAMIEQAVEQATTSAADEQP